MAATLRAPSRGLRLFTRFLRRAWQWILVVVLALTLGVAAWASPGLDRADVHLDEGTVYAVHRGLAMTGMVNTQIEELSQATTVADSTASMLQDEDMVLIRGEESNTLTRYNPSRNRLESPMQLPVGADVQLVAGRLLVTSPQNGRVWFGDAADVLQMDPDKDKAQFEVGVGGVATLTTRGEIIGLDVAKSQLVREVDGQRRATPLPFTLDAKRLGGVELSAVGGTAVVLDRVSGRIWVEGTKEVLDVSGAANARLLPPVAQVLGGKEDVRAVYATEAGLIAVTPDGTRSLSGQLDGMPVEPVQVGDRLYGAFGNRFVKRCADGGASVREIPGRDAGDNETLSLQVNRRTVALNDAATGVVWLVDQGMARIDDWERFVTKDSDEPPPPDAPVTDDKAERDEENRPPVAKDDELTARQGRATILDVLDNDSDPDGDVLTISAPDELDGASLQTVRGGTGLQVTIPPESTAGTLTFSYTISDGELSDTAQVTLHVADADPGKENKPPHPFELAKPMDIQKGKAFTKRVLPDWRDPEGDPLILEDASLPPGSEDLVTFNPDGTVSYQDIGKTTGQKKINLVVSDGTDTAEGELVVNVGEEPVKPVAYADFASVQVGETVEVRPLDNDIGEDLLLQEVTPEQCESCTVTPDYNDQSFTFSSTEAGTFYLTYNVASTEFETGVVRIDVVAPGSDNPPVAALDVALLPPEGSVLVDPLANDTDVDGDVLVIQSIQADPSLEVELDRRHLMTIKAKSTPKAAVTVEYSVSDGRHIALGTVVVIPTRTTGSVEPVAADDDINIRAGSVGTAPVLVNDESPIGLDLKLSRILETPLPEDTWIDGETIRVRIPAGSQRQQLAVLYEVVDAEGNTASAVLNVTAISDDAPNQPPAPGEVVDRVLAGTTTRIPIDLDGIDPNGDPVRLLGLGAGPKLGRVTEVGDGFLTYEAFPGSEGTDTFRYEVADAHGAVASGQLRVGVAPPGDVNEPPVAVHDRIVVRPGRPIQIPVLANDHDFEGDTIGFAGEDAVAMDDAKLHAEIVNDREVSVDPITKPGEYHGTYRVTDSRKQEGIGSFTVVVDEDAPLLPPVARDDTMSFLDVIDEDILELDVLRNDFDPDGDQGALKVSVPGAKADDEDAPRAVGNKVSVPVRERTQQVRYTLTDADGQVSHGLATVPGTEDAQPVVRDPKRVLRATAGQPVHISFDDLLMGTEGRKVKLTSTDTIVATNGSAVPATGGIEYTPDPAHRGPAAVVFEVVDQVPEGDESAKRAYLTIRVEVKAPENEAGNAGEDAPSTQLPPKQVSRAHLKVGPGEGEFRLAMMPLFQDPKGLDFTFEDWADAGGDAPIEWRTEQGQSVVVATAPLTAKAGTTKTLKGRVKNAQGASAEFEVLLEMVSSRQPLTTTTTDVVEDAAAGQPVAIPVTANDVSHLTADKGLTVTGARIVSGSGKIEHDEHGVTITPAEGFVGTLTASYSVQDATKDPARVVDGSIRLDVKDRPAPPSAPFGGVPGDGQIRFEYRSGSSNGYPVEKREVVATAPGQSPVRQACSGNTCTVTGLRNNVPWTLSVVETNKLGASEPSPQSAPYTPDVKPLPPGQPTVERGDQSLTTTWPRATFENRDNEGSPVERYTVALYDSNGKKLGTKTVGGSVLQHRWTGLTNGKSYTFGVVATNKAGSSGESERSTPMFPVGPPKGSATIDADPILDSRGGRFTVSVAPGTLQPNGDPAMRLSVVPVVNGTERAELAKELRFPPNAKQEHTFGSFELSPVQFRVYATNLHSRRLVGQTPKPLIAWRRPEVGIDKTMPSWAPTGRLLVRLRSNMTPAEIQQAGGRFQYSANGGVWHDLEPRGDGWYRTGELPAGQEVRVGARLVLTKASDGELVGASAEASGRPLSPNPRPLEYSEIRANSPNSVRVLFNEPTEESSGGWDPAGYSLQTFFGVPRLDWVVVNEDHPRVTVNWRGYVPQRDRIGRWHRDLTPLQTIDVPVGDVSSLWYHSTTGRVKISIRHVKDGHCKVWTKGKGTELAHVDAGSGVIKLDKVLRNEADPLKPYKEVEVRCTVNGSSRGWYFNLK